jgi:hypothetical protein
VLFRSRIMYAIMMLLGTITACKYIKLVQPLIQYKINFFSV